MPWGNREDPRAITYRTLQAVRRRCLNKHHLSYPSYGGAGIRVYFGWLGPGGLAAFIADVGLRPGRDYHLDRIDPTGHYEPGNVRWRRAAENLATAKSAAPNLVTAMGPDGLEHKMALGAWAELLGVSYRSLCRRLQRATTPERRARVFAVKARR